MKLCVNKYILCIGIIIILNLQGFYLLPNLPIDISDLTIIIECMFWIYVYLTCRKKTKKKYGLIILFSLILVISSSIMAKISYNQPLFMGIRAQRAWIMSLLMYFPLSQLVKCNRISLKQIMQMLDLINFIYMGIIIVQFITGPNHLFLNVRNSIRYGTLRIAVLQSFICISYFYHLKNLLINKNQFKSILFVIVTLFTVIFINKGRASTIILIGPSLLMIFAAKWSRKKFAIVSGIMIVLIGFINSQFGEMLIDSIVGSTSVDAGTLIREVGRQFYMEQVFRAPIFTLFGCGYANIDWPATVVGIRYTEGITYNDNGIYGLIFYYGFIIFAWILVLNIQLMYDSWKYGKKIYFFMVMRSFLGLFTIFPECYSTQIGFALICVLIEAQEKIDSHSDLKQCKELSIT